MRVSDVVEEGRVEYVPVAPPALVPLGLSMIRFSPAGGRERFLEAPVKLLGKFKISSPTATSQKRFLVENPSFASALTAQVSRGKSRRSGRDRRADAVLQMGFP